MLTNTKDCALHPSGIIGTHYLAIYLFFEDMAPQNSDFGPCCTDVLARNKELLRLISNFALERGYILKDSRCFSTSLTTFLQHLERLVVKKTWKVLRYRKISRLPMWRLSVRLSLRLSDRPKGCQSWAGFRLRSPLLISAEGVVAMLADERSISQRVSNIG